MENIKNRFFYKETPITQNFKKWFENNRMKYLKFRIRIFDEDIDTLSKLFDGINVVKREKKTERDGIEESGFIQLEYNQSKGKDIIMGHSVIIADRKYEDEIKEKLNNCFKVRYTRSNRNGHYSITTTLNEEIRKSFTWVSKGKTLTPKYPINILSYGRHNKYGRTHLLLTELKINHYLFIQPNQEQQYRRWYDDTYCELIVCPTNFSELNMGSTPVRNYIMEYWKKKKYVWLLDDNIKGYQRFHEGKKNDIKSPVIFRSIENYVVNCKNVGIASHNFKPFVCNGDYRYIITKNTKCFSSLLINNRIGLKFRRRYQEDHFLSVECINKGYATLSFNHILYDKNTSGKDKGGNQVKMYNDDGYKRKYDYMVNTMKELYDKGEIKIKEGSSFDTFVLRDKNMKSKEYHARINYPILEGHSNTYTFDKTKFRSYEKYLTKKYK